MRVSSTPALSFLLVTTLSGCVMVGNGKLATEPRETPEFTRLSVGGGLHVVAVIGPRSVVLTIDENLLRHVLTTVEDGVLEVRPEEGANLAPSEEARLEVASPVLTGVELSGACIGTAEVSPAGEQVFSLSGASELRVPNARAELLSVKLSGSSHLDVAGDAPRLDAHASGSSSLASQVTASTVAVHLSGSSDAQLFAARALSGEMSGSSHLVVSGSPRRREVSTSGSSSVRFEE